MLDVNLTGAFLTVKAALPDLTRKARRAAAAIVFIASTAGLKGYPYVAAYCAAKHGVVGLTRALAAELAPHRRHRQRRLPRLHRDAAAGSLARQHRRQDRPLAAPRPRRELQRLNPQGRFVTPEEVADTVLWLCTPAAAGDHRPGHLGLGRRGMTRRRRTDPRPEPDAASSGCGCGCGCCGPSRAIEAELRERLRPRVRRDAAPVRRDGGARAHAQPA